MLMSDINLNTLPSLPLDERSHLPNTAYVYFCLSEKTMTNLEKLTIETELERQSDRWIAEVIELPGVLVYGSSETEAINKAKALALRVLAERLEHGEPTPGIGQIFRLKPTSSTTEVLVT